MANTVKFQTKDGKDVLGVNAAALELVVHLNKNDNLNIAGNLFTVTNKTLYMTATPYFSITAEEESGNKS